MGKWRDEARVGNQFDLLRNLDFIPSAMGGHWRVKWDGTGSKFLFYHAHFGVALKTDWKLTRVKSGRPERSLL